MKTVIQGKVDIFAYQAVLKTNSFFATNRAQLVISTPRTWYGRMVSAPLPSGPIAQDVDTTDIVAAGGFKPFVERLLREKCHFPMAVKAAKS